MNKPNFSTMTSTELKAYALAHREDDDVFAELTKRVSEKGTRYPYPQTDEDLEQMRQLFQLKVTGDSEI
jgi:aromatic ring hydroxylase